MDVHHAQELERQLSGTHVGGWLIGALIGFGGSAAVFSATKDSGDTPVALKIIDPAIIHEFGEQGQLERIKLEARLIGKSHPNLIDVYEASKCPTSGHLFVAMKKLKYSTLTNHIKAIASDEVGRIIEQVARAAEWLDQLGVCHRDIKPDNVMLSDDHSHAVLMDLGILSPFSPPDGVSMDFSGERFIGTARYCPKEFVRNQVGDSDDGLRTLSFYQLGALLHDLIMSKRMFDDVSGPYALLLDAIDNEVPVVESLTVPAHLVHLARDCLTKDANDRLRLVNWRRFQQAAPNASKAARARVRATLISPSSSPAVSTGLNAYDRNKINELGRHVRDQIRKTCEGNAELLKPIVDFDLAPNGVEIMTTFEKAPDREVLRSFEIRFQASPSGANGDTYILDAYVTWADDWNADDPPARHRVCIIREPDGDLQADLEDFIYRSMAAAMSQPDAASGAALKMDG